MRAGGRRSRGKRAARDSRGRASGIDGREFLAAWRKRAGDGDSRGSSRCG
jgi:hypothetical protein